MNDILPFSHLILIGGGWVVYIMVLFYLLRDEWKYLTIETKIIRVVFSIFSCLLVLFLCLVADLSAIIEHFG